MPHDGREALTLTDTTPRAMAKYRERLRATPPRERLERALRLSEQARAATMADVRRQLPGASEDEWPSRSFDVSPATSWQTGLPPGALSAG